MNVASVSATKSTDLITPPAAGVVQSDIARALHIAARKLNSLGIVDREFAVIRDPDTNRFVVVVRERSSGTVLDQFPAESILRMLEQVPSPIAASRQPAFTEPQNSQM